MATTVESSRMIQFGGTLRPPQFPDVDTSRRTSSRSPHEYRNPGSKNHDHRCHGHHTELLRSSGNAKDELIDEGFYSQENMHGGSNGHQHRNHYHRNYENRNPKPTNRVVIDCNKNPGHNKFIPIKSLKKKHLPSGFKREDWVELIKLKGVETVKLEVAYTSPSRPDDLGFAEYKHSERVRDASGTAFLLDMEKTQRCPFNDCRERRPHRVSGFFKVITAGHVVFNDEEARSTTIWFFYDDESDKSNIVEARGVRVSSIDLEKNRSVVECVTHDLGLYERLMEIRRKRVELLNRIGKEKKDSEDSGSDTDSGLGGELTDSGSIEEPSEFWDEMVVLISHPHGKSKQVTIGELITLVKYDEDKAKVVDGKTVVSCQLSYTTPTCPGSGGGSVNMLNSREGCIGFAPHCACGEKEKEGISGLGWTLA